MRVSYHHKRLGILGGLGPEATLFFEAIFISEVKKLSHKSAMSDQDYPEHLIAIQSKIPDRTAWILNHDKPNPFAQLLAGMMILQDAACDFAVIPCNTAHYWLEPLRNNLRISIVDMIYETLVKIIKDIPVLALQTQVLLLATTGTITSKLYQSQARKFGIEVITPDRECDQHQVMEMIYNPKWGAKSGHTIQNKNSDRATEALKTLLSQYKKRYPQITVAILGCTELPLIIAERVYDGLTLYDPMQITAEKCAKIALGHDPIPEHNNDAYVASHQFQMHMQEPQIVKTRMLQSKL